MDCERTCSWPRFQPVADELAFDYQRTSAPALVFWPPAFGGEWAVCDANSRNVQNCAQVKRKAGSPRVVAAGAID
jgi:hypothetical protein